MPWSDVEATGVVTEPATMVWLRLRSYDRYLASIPDGGAAKADGMSRVLVPVAQLLMRGTGRGDRPAAEFADLLERYRQAAG